MRCFEHEKCRPDPRMEQVIQAVGGLTKQVSILANQVEELRKEKSRAKGR